MIKDKAFWQMVHGALAEIQEWIDAGGGIFTLDDVAWDFPAATNEEPIYNNDPFTTADDLDAAAQRDEERRLKASHSIGFITGCAAALDVTPREFLDHTPPLCVVEMGCQCAGHARGAVITAKCDATEQPQPAPKKSARKRK